MTQPSHEPRFDVASAISQGKRDYQEDALVAYFPLGTNLTFAVLADGMGGHAAGDVASKIIVTEVFSELKFQSETVENNEQHMAAVLRETVMAANACINGYVTDNPETRGMGATLVAPIFVENRLFWISVGDSPLYHFRDGELKQLNEDHSMAPQIDLMVQSGIMDEETGRNHPDRNCLTSVLIGGEIAKIDCPTKPFELAVDDIIVLASDGLQFLDNDVIESILVENNDEPSSTIAHKLLSAIDELDDPDQDNISFAVIKVKHINTAQNGKSKPMVLEQEQVVDTSATAIVAE